MKQDVSFFKPFGDLGDRKNYSRLVVGKHYRHDRSIVIGRLKKKIKIQLAQVVYWHKGDPVTLSCKMFAKVQYCRMFDPSGDDMFLPGMRFHGAHNGCVVAFGAAACKDDLFRLGAQK